MNPFMLAEATTVDVSSIVTALTTTLSSEQVISTAATIISAAAGLFLIYWGIRKTTTVLTRAFSRGKIRF